MVYRKYDCQANPYQEKAIERKVENERRQNKDKYS